MPNTKCQLSTGKEHETDGRDVGNRAGLDCSLGVSLADLAWDGSGIAHRHKTMSRSSFAVP